MAFQVILATHSQGRDQRAVYPAHAAIRSAIASGASMCRK
jgi:hypothetical protein